jgi:hypothetical protein
MNPHLILFLFSFRAARFLQNLKTATKKDFLICLGWSWVLFRMSHMFISLSQEIFVHVWSGDYFKQCYHVYWLFYFNEKWFVHLNRVYAEDELELLILLMANAAIYYFKFNKRFISCNTYTCSHKSILIVAIVIRFNNNATQKCVAINLSKCCQIQYGSTRLCRYKHM